MLVKDVMHKKAKVINFQDSVEAAAKIMVSEDCGSIPVEKDDRMVGMLTDRDIAIRVVAKGKDPKNTKVKDVMSEGINYCFEDDNLEEASAKMSGKKHRRLPVVNQERRLVGMLSLGDIARKNQATQVSGDILSHVCQ